MSILWDMDGPLLDIQTALEMTKKIATTWDAEM